MEFDIDLILAMLAKEVADYKVPVVDLIAVQSQGPLPGAGGDHPVRPHQGRDHGRGRGPAVCQGP